MTFWQPLPPAQDDAVPYRLVRVAADKPLKGIITCPDIVGAPTHFARNRTQPCPGTDTCDLCADGFAWRWHAYVSLLVNPGYEHVILELTAAGSQTLRNYNELNSGVLGAEILAHRPSKKHNGRVVCQCRRIDLQGILLPPPPCIEKILCHIWGVQYVAPKNNWRIRPGSKDIQLPDNALPRVS